MGFGGGGSKAAPVTAAPEPVGTPAVENDPKPAGMQNRTEASPLGRPLLTPDEAKPRKPMIG